MEIYLKNKYPYSKFILFCSIFNKSDYCGNSRALYYRDSDNFSLVNYQTNYLNSAIRWFFISEIKNPKNIFINIQKSPIMKKISNIFSDNLEDREYISDKCEKYLNNICQDCNNYLLNNKEIYPVSNYIIGYIFKKPLIGHIFNYKIIDLEYIELNCSYSNKSLYAIIFQFLINN